MDAVMMMRAQHDAVADIGSAAMTLPPSDVVRLRMRGRPIARRPRATAIALDECELLRSGEESGGAAELERLGAVVEQQRADAGRHRQLARGRDRDRLIDTVDRGVAPTRDQGLGVDARDHRDLSERRGRLLRSE
jgi:hypothetical protein